MSGTSACASGRESSRECSRFILRVDRSGRASPEALCDKPRLDGLAIRLRRIGWVGRSDGASTDDAEERHASALRSPPEYVLILGAYVCDGRPRIESKKVVLDIRADKRPCETGECVWVLVRVLVVTSRTSLGSSLVQIDRTRVRLQTA